MIHGGYIMIDKDGRPVRGFGGRISVMEDRAEARRLADSLNAGGDYAIQPVTVAPVELRIIQPAGKNGKPDQKGV